MATKWTKRQALFSGCPQVSAVGGHEEVSKQLQSDIVNSKRKAHVRMERRTESRTVFIK